MSNPVYKPILAFQLTVSYSVNVTFVNSWSFAFWPWTAQKMADTLHNLQNRSAFKISNTISVDNLDLQWQFKILVELSHGILLSFKIADKLIGQSLARYLLEDVLAVIVSECTA